jgi:hypothetical protein
LNKIAAGIAMLASAWIAAAPAQPATFAEFSTQGLPGSQGLVVRVRHPAAWKPVPSEDAQAVAELRGPEGELTAILQIGRGQRRDDVASLCTPERARTMLQDVASREPGTRVTDVVFRPRAQRAAYELRYERRLTPEFLAVHSVIACLKDTRLVVSCGALARRRTALAGIEPVCDQVLESLDIVELP